MKGTRDQRFPPDEDRRRLLKTSAIVGGAAALGHLPYERPAIKSFFGVRAAWAQVTGPTTIVMSGVIGATTPGTPDNPVSGTGSDAWNFEVFNAGTQLAITATSNDGFSNIEIFLFPSPAASVIPGDINLLNGKPTGLDAGGVGAAEAATVTAPVAGVYSIFIEDSRSPANEVSGAYTIQIVGDMGLGSPTQIFDENADLDRSSG